MDIPDILQGRRSSGGIDRYPIMRPNYKYDQTLTKYV